MLLLDKIDSLDHLKDLDAVLAIGGALRVISIIDKYDYDRWAENEQDRVWLERNFDIVKCPPVWSENIARRFCEYYFEVSESLLRSRLFLDIMQGLNLFCSGAPGRFARVLQDHWLYCMTDDQNAVILSQELTQEYQIWAKCGRLLAKKWKAIWGDFSPIALPRHSTMGERESRARLFLYSVVNRLVAMGNRGFTERQVLAICQEEARRHVVVPDDVLTEICDRLIASLNEAGVLVQLAVCDE